MSFTREQKEKARNLMDKYANAVYNAITYKTKKDKDLCCAAYKELKQLLVEIKKSKQTKQTS